MHFILFVWEGAVYLPCKKFCPGKSWKWWELALSSRNTKILLKVSCSRLGPCSVCPQIHRCVCLTLGRRARESFLMSEATIHPGFKEHVLFFTTHFRYTCKVRVSKLPSMPSKIVMGKLPCCILNTTVCDFYSQT